MTDEKKLTDDELWEKTGKDIAATQAADEVVPVAETKVSDVADRMAGMPEPTRKLIEGLEAKTVEQEKRLHTVGQQLAAAHGNMGHMKQLLDESRATLEKITPTVAAVEADRKAAAKVAADAKALKRTELREKLADLPDVVEYLDMVLPADAEPAEVKAVVKPEVVKGLDPEERKVLILQRELSDRVPGWMAKRDSAEWKPWLLAQSAEIKANSESWDVDVAASVFAAFDKHKSDAARVASVEADRQERLRRGEGVKGRGSSTGNVDTSDDALWKKTGVDWAKAQSA